MIITTGENESPRTVARAKELAQAEAGAVYVRRAGRSLKELKAVKGDSDVLVVLENRIRLAGASERPMEFHPSMSYVRAKRVLKGEKDLMLEAAGVVPGDVIVDCTAGLGADSMMFAVGTGPAGSVIAMESSFPLYMLLKEGLRTYRAKIAEFTEALQRIEVRHTDHLTGLKSLPDKSVDIVYFDPMFREPTMESSSLSPLRAYANDEPLSLAAIEEARRVARKTVVLKEKRDSGEFERLGFGTPERNRTKITYGVMHLDR
ncbi:class I SAM-dependent methyltransferase [Paenibacillus pinistramenti]|uniref:class I SAM-dependent methyltransferase n=1 Tax=Paenibacillus pinistramenti TaxID=1768003 RepID=UPI001107AB58|nr:class I SAM-dependent methyltransferase [Paenibacillus pinistramenti]